jgi:endonuclease/exonuclease/phosphatase family metal-dependent hydrolase
VQRQGFWWFFIKPKFLSWNVRGLNEGDKRLKVRNLLRQWKADIICLQETKLDFVSNSLVRSLWGCHFVDWCYLASRGASGSILIMWDRRIVEKIEVYVGEFVVACSFRSVADNFSWAFAGVYGPNIDSLRSSLWDELAGLSSWWELPWCIGGDFNVTRFPAERSRDVRLNAAMMEFSDFIFEQDLMDLPLVGGPFTWSNNQETPSWSHLDRFLVSPDWEVKFPGSLQKRLPRLCSDHFPILLDCGGVHWGPRPFKFENM